MSRATSSKEVLYSYVSATNKKFVKKKALQMNLSESEIINEFITANRLNRKVKLQPKVLKGEQRLQKAKERKRAKLKSLSK